MIFDLGHVISLPLSEYFGVSRCLLIFLISSYFIVVQRTERNVSESDGSCGASVLQALLIAGHPLRERRRPGLDLHALAAGEVHHEPFFSPPFLLFFPFFCVFSNVSIVFYRSYDEP